MMRFVINRMISGLMILCGLSAGYGEMSQAASPPWSTTPYSRFSENEELGDMLRSFASSQNIPLVVSDKVQGQVNARFTDVLPQVVFDRLLQAYNLIGYYDGHALYVYRADEIQTRLIKLNFAPVDHLKETLTQLGIFDQQLTWRAADNEGIVYLSGPPRFIELATEMATTLDTNYPINAAQRAGQIYKWVDQNNITHYSSEPPPKNARKVQTVDLQTPSVLQRLSNSQLLRRQVEQYRKGQEALRNNPDLETITIEAAPPITPPAKP